MILNPKKRKRKKKASFKIIHVHINILFIRLFFLSLTQRKTSEKLTNNSAKINKELILY